MQTRERKQPVRRVTESDADLEDTSLSEEDIFLLNCSYTDNPEVNITIQTNKIKMTIDTGASINVIDEDTFSKFDDIKLRKTKIKAFTYGSKEPVQFLGNITTVMETKRSITSGEIFVVTRKRSGCLLSCRTAQELRLISLNVDELNKCSMENKHLKTQDKQLESILSSHRKIFKGLGKLKSHKVSLNIDKSITPVSIKQRKIPFHIREKDGQAVVKLLNDDIIERIPDNEPTSWVSHIVAVPQSYNSIRLCLDMRKPNLAIQRTNTYHGENRCAA